MDEQYRHHIENMENGMCRTADRTDIWQDRLIYAICGAIRFCLMELLRMRRNQK